MHGVPTHFLGLLDALEKGQAAGVVGDLKHLRFSPLPSTWEKRRFDVTIGQASRQVCVLSWALKGRPTKALSGSPIPINLMRQLIAKLNLVDLSIAYGMSEFGTRRFD